LGKDRGNALAVIENCICWPSWK